MSGKRYSEEFKIEAVRQITERNDLIGPVFKRFGVTTKSLYTWVKRYRDGPSYHSQITEQQREIRDLTAQLKRTEEERDILKKGRRIFCQRVRVRYVFIAAHQTAYYSFVVSSSLCVP